MLRGSWVVVRGVVHTPSRAATIVVSMLPSSFDPVVVTHEHPGQVGKDLVVLPRNPCWLLGRGMNTQPKLDSKEASIRISIEKHHVNP